MKSVRVTLVLIMISGLVIVDYIEFCLISAAVEPAKFQQKLTRAFKNQSNLDAVRILLNEFLLL